MSELKNLNITLPPLQITITDEKQVNLQWVKSQLPEELLANSQGHDQPTLSNEHKRIIASQKLSRRPDNDIINLLVKMGADIDLVKKEVQEINQNPYFQAGQEFVQSLEKLESQLKNQEKLASLSSKYGKIERKSSPSRQYFLENYYAANYPVILTNIMHGWRALQLWNPQYLKEKYGEVEVEIQANRNSDPEYELQVDKHRKKMFLKDYVQSIQTGGKTNDYYMVANNQNLDKSDLKNLLTDIDIFPEYLDPANSQQRIFFWFGPGGTITPLHHDTSNIILAQVYGRKLIKMISPDQSPLLYNYRGVFSKVDCAHPDYEKYPLYSQVKSIEVILEPGEAIFIPVGWWHYVEALDVSISVSFTNFVFPNHYEWKFPQINRY